LRSISDSAARPADYFVVYCKGNEMDSTHRMCELFGQCLPEPLAIQIRSDIVEQRVRENNAYASYAEVRRQLLEAVRIGYDPPN
jgi:hypothetical protein